MPSSHDPDTDVRVAKERLRAASRRQSGAKGDNGLAALVTRDPVATAACAFALVGLLGPAGVVRVAGRAARTAATLAAASQTVKRARSH